MIQILFTRLYNSVEWFRCYVLRPGSRVAQGARAPSFQRAKQNFCKGFFVAVLLARQRFTIFGREFAVVLSLCTAPLFREILDLVLVLKASDPQECPPKLHLQLYAKVWTPPVKKQSFVINFHNVHFAVFILLMYVSNVCFIYFQREAVYKKRKLIKL